MTCPISLEGVSLRFGGVQILSSLTLEVQEGEVLSLVGPSGSGKTTLLRVILGLVAPDSGLVRLKGVTASVGGKVIMLPEERNLAVVFQDLALWPHLTVDGNLSFGLESRRVPRDERKDRIARILQRVGLAGLEHRYPGQLSGGERQRVAIARALVLDPRAVLLDEPLTNLDVGLKRELLAHFRELFLERRTTALYVTHEPREAIYMGKRLAVMEKGRVIQVGTLGDLEQADRTAFLESFLEDVSPGPGKNGSDCS
jgi:ABC-type Fe3+/spermidine/putrescine transport system ATPase subunit